MKENNALAELEESVHSAKNNIKDAGVSFMVNITERGGCSGNDKINYSKRFDRTVSALLACSYFIGSFMFHPSLCVSPDKHRKRIEGCC